MRLEEGTEFDIKNSAEWNSLGLDRGEVLEIHLPSTDLPDHPPNIWAGFWVKQVVIEKDGDYVAIVKCLGCSDQDWTKYFSNQFNRKVGTIHFCSSRPCAATKDYTMHVTRLKVYSMGAFERPYLSSYIKRQVQKWEEDEPIDVEGAVTVSGAGIPMEAEPPDGAEGEVHLEVSPGEEEDDHQKKEKSRPADPRKAAEPKAKVTKMKEDERQRLRERLEATRAKMLNAHKKATVTSDAPGCREEEKPGEESPSPGYSPSELRVGEPRREELALEDALDIGPSGSKPPHKEKKKSRRKRREARHDGDPSHSEERGKRQKKEDTKGSITRNLQNQLALKARENAREKEEKLQQEKKRQHKKNPQWQLAKILTQMGVGRQKKKKKRDGDSSDPEDAKKSKKKDKKDSKKKKKRRHGPSDDPGSGGSSYQTSSWEGDSDAALESESSSSQGKRMLAPLKRKSREKPGSVLQLLIEHARSQLDQSSKVAIGSSDTISVTKGVKMGSYFSIIVRPQLGSAMPQARELHHLSQSIDLLRQGDLDLLGDVLAGRFLSVHQSVLDGGWSTARHLELLPLEDNTAAGPEVILEAKRHAKLALKLTPGNQDSWGWGAGGKSRGGRGRGGSWHENSVDTKGKGKKGVKGKGKGKGWTPQEKELDGKTKERVPEK